MTVKITSALAVTLAITSGLAFSADNESAYNIYVPENLSLQADKTVDNKNLIVLAMADSDASKEVQSSTIPAVEPMTTIAGGLGATAGRSAASIKYGEISITPSMGVYFGYNDNVTSANTKKISSSVFRLTPKVVASVDKGSDFFSLTYGGDLIYLPSSTTDNRNTHNFSLVGDQILTTRNKFDWALNYINGAEARGLNDASRTLNMPTSVPDQYRTYEAKGKYVFGAKGAKANIELKSNYLDKEYTNNRLTTATRDYSLFNYGAEAQLRVSPKTQIFLDVNQSKINYKSSLSTQDSTETKYLLGARWKALEKTEGYFKIGMGTKEFDVASLSKRSTTVYESGIKWSPLTYSTLDLSLARNYVDGSSINTPAGLSRIINARWNHQWKSYFKTSAGVVYTNVNYAESGRLDKTESYTLSAVYDAKRWLGFGVDYTYINRDSSDMLYSYTSNLLYFSTLLSM